MKSPAPNILLLSCQGPNPADTAAEIANALAQEFLKHQEDSYEKRCHETSATTHSGQKTT
ncbi:MAG: hypothetical protein R3C49_16710 [Planctomycetaceae bacterium]